MKNPKFDKLIEEITNKKEVLLDKISNTSQELASKLKEPATHVTAGALAVLLATGMTINGIKGIDTNLPLEDSTTTSNVLTTESTTYQDLLDRVTETTVITGTTAPETTKPSTTAEATINEEEKGDFQGRTDGYSSASFYRSAKVMSFNIRCITNENNEINNWDNRKEVLVNQIEENNPDIIGFQEIQQGHMEYLTDNLEGYTYYYFTNKGEDRKYTTQAIFFKTQKYCCTDSGKFWLSETPDESSVGWDARCYRIAAYCTLREYATNKEFNFYNIHLDHVGERSRVKSAQMIADHVDESGLPAIIVGDFNIGENSEMYDVMSSNFDDAKYVADDVKSNTNTYNAWNQPAREGREPIDFIFFTKGDFEVESYEVLNEDLGAEDNYADKVYASDHFAIVSEIEY